MGEFGRLGMKINAHEGLKRNALKDSPTLTKISKEAIGFD